MNTSFAYGNNKCHEISLGSGAFGKLLWLLAIGFVLTSARPLQAAKFYVSPSGSDTNTGRSPSKPWQSIAKVNSSSFSPGDLILFRAGGTWNGQLAPRGSGASGTPIVIDMYGKGDKPKIHGPGTNGSAAVLIKDESYWEINNLEVTNRQPEGGSNALLGILVTSTSPTTLWNHIYIKDCYVHDVNSVPYGAANYTKRSGGIIYDLNIKDALVQGCHVARVTVEGIRNSSPPSTSQFVIRKNVVENVYGDGIVLHGSSGGSLIEYNVVHNVCMSDAANYAAVWTFASTRTVIQYNEVYGTTAGGPNDGESFDADIDTDGDVFQYNYSHDNARGFMLFMSSAKNIIVRYNVSQNDEIGVSRSGGRRLFHQNEKTGSTSNQIYNNTFYVGDLDSIFDQGHNVAFSNNIIYSTGTVKKFSTIPISASSIFENNDFYPASMTTVNGPAGTVSRNITSDPLFTAPGIGAAGVSVGVNGFLTVPTGYQLQPGSPALKGGKVMNDSGGFDYFGNRVSASVAPNIGAYNGDAVLSRKFSK